MLQPERGNIMYFTYEEPFTGRSFTEHQMNNIYQIMIDKSEYPTYEGWVWDMEKYNYRSGR